MIKRGKYIIVNFNKINAEKGTSVKDKGKLTHETINY